MRKTIAIFALLILSGGKSEAQLPEILGWGLGSVLNWQIAKGQERTFPAGKLLFNIYLGKTDGEKRLTVLGWDPSTQTSVWFGPEVILQPVVRINGQPPSAFEFFVNHAVYRRLRNQIGRFNGNGEATGATGLGKEGGPLIRVGDLPLGWNTITVKWSRTGFADCQLMRLEFGDYLRLIANEANLTQIAGAGNSVFPVTPVFTAVMPDGRARFFKTSEEVQQAFGLFSQATTPSAPLQPIQPAQPRVTPPPSEPAGRAAAPTAPTKELSGPVTPSTAPSPVKPVEDTRPEIRVREPEPVQAEVTIRLTRYELGEINHLSPKDQREAIRRGASEEKPLSDRPGPIGIPEGYGIGLLVTASEPFTIELISPAGKQLGRLSARKVAEGFEFVGSLAFKGGDTDNRLVATTASGKRRELTFRRQDAHHGV